jgi:alpha-methylacyl-CoA racemase
MDSASKSAGPLTGLKVLELTSIGPGPHCAMLLADLGAEVIRFDRPGGNGWPNPIVDRGRHSMTVDIRELAGRELCLAAAEKADVLIEGSRPGVMERLGLGPLPVLERNPRLIYARMTGWGQTGPLAHVAGHDINFIALTGALAAMGSATSPPRPPLNLVGDFGGGSLFLAFGIMAALWERNRSGLGQVIDAAIVDGVSSMMTAFAGLLPARAISIDVDRNPLCGAAPFYRCYRCLDGTDIAIGAIESKFYQALLKRVGAGEELLANQYDTANWGERSELLARLFATNTRERWCDILESEDVCFAPVLTLAESQAHRHLLDRETYVNVAGLVQAAPAPRFSRTPGSIRTPGSAEDALKAWGVNCEVR